MDNFEILEKSLDRHMSSAAGSHKLLIETSSLFADKADRILALFDFYQDAEKKTWTYTEVPLLSFEKTGEVILICSRVSQIRLSREAFFSYLALLSDLFLPILPLGSCVRLKEGAFQMMPETPGDYAPEVVIVDRYLAVPEAGIYFPYCGAVYPFGTFGTERKIHFGLQLVEEVLRTGYADEKEEVFHSLMKEEYILEKGLHSMSFASNEEAEILQNMMAEAEKRSRHE
jgi:hypothetical protein